MTDLLAPPAGRYESSCIVDNLVVQQRAAVAELVESGVIPHLGIILPAYQDGSVHGPSQKYVGRKRAHGEAIGAKSTVVTVGRYAVSTGIEEFNDDSAVHGLIVQLPLPSYPNELPELLAQRTQSRLKLIDPAKDVDALRPRDPNTPFDEKAEYAAATPAAVMRMLDEQQTVPLEPGSRVLVNGAAGFLVGRHMAPLLRARGITPLTHDKSHYSYDVSQAELAADLRDKITEADIVVSCVGQPGMITPAMLPKKRPMVIIDAGLKSVKGQLRGDLDPAVETARPDILYTPPINGVGPLTVTELWQNLIRAARRANGAYNLAA
ncbi:MAG TPA: tetrahydrofolate dehydrogenase/cyclohydrolase catalytic domain-containing protein [Candidatus Saccharimonadales bacterium]|nr:tetrahydrofolate dehydrogenase/cyclohydrolase catalytic domain-containing protein [Candidatus Saccharimonadales bacterium]